MKKRESLENRSPDVQEIIGQLPPWLIRWGMTAIFFVLCALVFLSHFIKYPDIATVVVEVEEVLSQGAPAQFMAEGLADEKYFRDIQPGQTAQIKLSSYPFQDYGALKGTIVSKSELNGKGQFEISIKLDRGLTTTNHKNIAYIPHMSGKAEIVLRESKLIDKIFNRSQ